MKIPLTIHKILKVKVAFVKSSSLSQTCKISKTSILSCQDIKNSFFWYDLTNIAFALSQKYTSSFKM